MSHFHFNISKLWSEPHQFRWSGLIERQGQARQRLGCLDDKQKLPRFVTNCPLTMQTIGWLRLLAWDRLPIDGRQWFGQEPVPITAYIAAFLVKVDQGIATVSQLRRFLVQHPPLIWALGFPLLPAGRTAGFDPELSLPSSRHMNRVLRQLPNELLQVLLDGLVAQVQARFPDEFGQTISMDTKHILAWVKQNNPKAYMKEGRFDKTQQPKGDPDCKLGCKRRHNRQVKTPATEAKAASQTMIGIGELYWGYASGVVATKLPGWGEFVLAELTQTFDKNDVSYFFPLMTQVEQRLGFRPRYGAFDAAYDAFYVYDYFYSDDHDGHHHDGGHHDGFAAVPFSEKGGHSTRQFDADGLPLCAAGLAMPLKFTYQDNTSTIIPYRRAKHVCPLLFPQPDGRSCPIHHKKWPAGGCATSLANTPGARLRHQLDRDGEKYKAVYAQRTAVERIFSQALNLGIERPKLRNRQAIANQNTLIYILINLRTWQRVLTKLQEAHN